MTDQQRTPDTAPSSVPAVVGVLGVIEDVAKGVGAGFVGEGQPVVVLGATRDELLQAVLDAIAQIETSGFRLQ